MQAASRTQTTRTTTHHQQQQVEQQQQQQLQQHAAAVAAATASSSSSRHHLSGSQQNLLGGDDDKVVLTGTGLQTARVNEHAEFIIDGTGAGYGKTQRFLHRAVSKTWQLVVVFILIHQHWLQKTKFCTLRK